MSKAPYDMRLCLVSVADSKTSSLRKFVGNTNHFSAFIIIAGMKQTLIVMCRSWIDKETAYNWLFRVFISIKPIFGVAVPLIKFAVEIF